MGIFLDTIEDNAEYGWDIAIDRYLNRNALSISSQVELIEICPRCLKRLLSKEALQDHIFYDHRSDEILIRVGDTTRTVERNSITIDNSSLQAEKEIYFHNQQLLTNNQTIELARLNSLVNTKTDDIFIQQYRKGIFGYLEASYFENESQSYTNEDAIRRLESVYGYLQPFNDGLSQQIRMSIALKFNWFKALRSASKGSIFYLAHIFFPNSYARIENIELSIESKNRKEYGVYISETSEQLLKLLEIFFDERINRARFQQTLRQINSDTDRSQSDSEKLSLVLARMHRKLNNNAEACEQYRRLAHHIDFSSEAREYVHGA